MVPRCLMWAILCRSLDLRASFPVLEINWVDIESGVGGPDSDSESREVRSITSRCPLRRVRSMIGRLTLELVFADMLGTNEVAESERAYLVGGSWALSFVRVRLLRGGWGGREGTCGKWLETAVGVWDDGVGWIGAGDSNKYGGGEAWPYLRPVRWYWTQMRSSTRSFAVSNLGVMKSPDLQPLSMHYHQKHWERPVLQAIIKYSPSTSTGRYYRSPSLSPNREQEWSYACHLGGPQEVYLVRMFAWCFEEDLRVDHR